jgi:FkbM family methyltransferase
MKFLTNFLLNKVPFVGIYKRFFLALINTFQSTKITYSQHGEDAILFERLQAYDLKSGIYIDVGSNHPTTISNTYLFYRQGFSGIAIEPNVELSKLHRKFRPRDICLSIGCSNEAKLGKLEIGKAPVLSHFQSDDNDMSNSLGFDLWRTEYVPILPLDLVLESIDYEWIYLLSVDVEGLDIEVLEGSRNILPKTLFCCVEVNNNFFSQKVDLFMVENGFIHEQKIGCNSLYRNPSSSLEKYKQ